MNRNNSVSNRQAHRFGTYQQGFVSLAVLAGIAAIVAVAGAIAIVVQQQSNSREIQLRAIEEGKNSEAQTAFSFRTDENGTTITTVGGCTVTEPDWGTVDCTDPLQDAIDSDEFNDQALEALLGDQLIEDIRQNNLNDIIGVPITFDSGGVIPESDGSIVAVADITVPEPSTLVLSLLGLGLLFGLSSKAKS